MRLAPHTIIPVCILALVGLLGMHTLGRGRIDLGEAVILGITERLDREPFSPEWLTKPPITFSCYGPVYYLAVRAAARLTGDSASLFAGRLVSLIAGVLSLFLIGAAVKRDTGRSDAALLAALLFLVSEPVLAWLPLERVDFLALAFMLMAYLAASRSIVIAAVAIALGALTRQTVVFDAVPIAASVWAIAGPGRAAKFMALAAGLTLAMWGAAIWQSNGFFWLAEVQANVNVFDPAQVGHYASYLLSSIIPAAAMMVVLILAMRNPLKYFLGRACLAGFLFHAVLDPVLGGKIGSNVNYMLPCFALAAVAIGAEGIPLLCRLSETRARLAMACVGVMVSIPAFISTVELARIPIGTPKSYEPVSLLLNSRPTPYVATDFPYMELTLQAGATPLVNDPYLMTQLWDTGRIDRNAVLAALEDGRVGWLLLDRMIDSHDRPIGRFWPVPVVESFRRNYRLVKVLPQALPEHSLYLYAHRNFARPRQ